MRKILVLLAAVLLSGVIGIQAVWANAAYQTVGVEVDGQALEADAYLVDGRTLVPLRAIFEKLQAKVEWEQESQSITAGKGGTTIKLQIDNAVAQVNDRTLRLDVPPRLIDSSTYVPLRFVSEALGAAVSYDGERQKPIAQPSKPRLSQIMEQ